MHKATIIACAYAAQLLLSISCADAVAWHPRRADMRRRFAGKPWLDVFSKADLLEEEFDAAEDLLSAGCNDAASAVGAGGQPAASGHPGSSHEFGDTSSHPASNPGTNPAEPATPPEDVMRGDSHGDVAESAAHVLMAGGSSSQPGTAVEVAAALRRAVRASSVTGAGLDPLKVISWRGVMCLCIRLNTV